MFLSVIICTHNPRASSLQRVIDALREQDLPCSGWELLLVDNGSEPEVDAGLAAWHPLGRVIREKQLGLTLARLRGIAESRGEAIVFVDDDNVLAGDYLRGVVGVLEAFPSIGAFGAGQIVPEFEVPPPEATRPMWGSLALRDVPADQWANFMFYPGPCGAGLCVRRRVAEFYAEALSAHPMRRALDRAGSSLASCGDDDIVATATDLGLGIGVFRELRMTHLIAAHRCTERYLVELWENIIRSSTLLGYVRGSDPRAAGGRTWKRRWFDACVARLELLVAGPLQRKRLAAGMRGRRAALREIEAFERSGGVGRP